MQVRADQSACPPIPMFTIEHEFDATVITLVDWAVDLSFGRLVLDMKLFVATCCPAQQSDSRFWNMQRL